jgi:charged multivesicular body protein 5
MLEDVGEISDILGRSYGTPEGLEEEDLDAELACLEDELEGEAELENVEASLQPSYLDSLPSQPNGALRTDANGAKLEEREELKV